MKYFTVMVLVFITTGICSAQKSDECWTDEFPKDTNLFGTQFIAEGREWDCRFLTYFFVNGTGDIPGSQEQGAIENAMDTRSAVTNDLTVYDLPSGLYFCRVNLGTIISWKRFVVIK